MERIANRFYILIFKSFFLKAHFIRMFFREQDNLFYWFLALKTKNVFCIGDFLDTTNGHV